MVVCSGIQAWQNQKNAFHNNSLNATRAAEESPACGMQRGLFSGPAVGRVQPLTAAPGGQTAGGRVAKIAGLYDLEDTLGSGHFAVVKSARHVFTGERVAVKVIDKTKLDEVSRSHLFQEVRCMKLVQHPNVVRLYEVIDTQTKLYLILELGDGGDLYDLIMRHDQGLDEPRAKEYFRQIVRAISYCHRLHVVHRDLKPENVVFFSKLGIVKLTDFGFSNRYCPGQKLQTSCGSLAYSAPEILLGDSYDAPAVDVWSLGVILYMLVCGQAPFQEANDSETLTMIMDCKYQVPAHVSAGCRRLIASMLVRVPERRATLLQIANDPWLLEGEGPQMATDSLPLVSRHQVSDVDHNHIVQKIINGNIATKDEILEALDKNEYNHITATYFLLAERRLRAQRQQQEAAGAGSTANRKRPVPAFLPGVAGKTGSLESQNNDNGTGTNNSSCLLLPPGSSPVQNSLLAPRTPGDGPQRSRKCSIVQEADEDDMPAVGRPGEELTVGGAGVAHCLLSRRGSRSEGRLNLVLQERICSANSAANKTPPKVTINVKKSPQTNGTTSKSTTKSLDNKCNDDKWTNNEAIETTILTDSRTVNLPLQINHDRINNANAEDNVACSLLAKPKYKTMPASASLSTGITLNDIPEKQPAKGKSDLPEASRIGEVINTTRRSAEPESPRHFQAQMNERLKQLEHKSQKFLEHRSNVQKPSEELMISDVFEETTQQYASKYISKETHDNKDQISPMRNSYNIDNQKQSMSGVGAVFPQRRARFHAKGRAPSCSSSDASDDDSEGRKKRRAHRIATSGNGKPLQGRRDSYDDSSDSQDPSCAHGDNSRNQQTSVTNGGPVDNSNSGGDGGNGQNSNNSSGNGGKQCGVRRHRSPNSTSSGSHSGRRRSGVETRLRESQSLNRITEVQEPAPAVHSIVISTTLTAQKIEHSNNNKTKGFGARLLQGLSGRRLMTNSEDSGTTNNTSVTVIDSNKENYTTSGKKLRVLGKYFQVHRKLCIPLPGLFQRGRLYKAQSCGSLEPPEVPGIINPSKKSFANGVPLADYNREFNGTLVPLVCSVHLVDITECCRMC